MNSYLTVLRARTFLRVVLGLLIVFRCASLALSQADPLNPFPAAKTYIGALEQWSYPADTASWRKVRDCEIHPLESAMQIRSTGIDPILVRSIAKMQHPFEARIVCRATTATSAQLFWDRSGKDQFNEKDSRRFEIKGDNAWHEYRLQVPDIDVQSLRFDPTDAPGLVEVKQFQLQAYRPAEFEFYEINWLSAEQLIVKLKNSTAEKLSVSISAQVTSAPQAATVAGKSAELAPSGISEVTLQIPLVSEGADSILLTAKTASTTGTRPCVRANVAYRITGNRDGQSWLSKWPRISNDQLLLQVAPDGSAGVLSQRAQEQPNWQLAAVLAPLTWDRQTLQQFAVESQPRRLICRSQSASIEFELVDNRLEIRSSGSEFVEGPVLRVPGSIEQALLAGVEHLGKSEASSSPIDISTVDRFRWEPPANHLTMQLAAIVTDRSAVSLRWTNPELQPVFATPNFFDGSSDSRIALRAKELAATIVVGKGWSAGGRVEDCILEYVRARDLAALPERPRTQIQQDELNWAGLVRSELLSPEQGWFHAIQPGNHGMPRNAAWFGDHASAVIALNKPLPVEPNRLVRGGSHIANDRWMFLNGFADQWIKVQAQALQSALSRQQPDGSVIYDGPWAEGHFEKTSSGQCGLLAEQLLNVALMTGDRQALQAGLKTLEYCRRFRTPRGAQVWECPLHAPDIMASAHLVRAHTIAFRLTGDSQHKDLAVRWAISGLPFVYQWSSDQAGSGMRYSTIATLCATHRVAPLWIGRPVQWCGLVYADALLDLAQVDKTLPWSKVSEGIYLSATHQQYTQGGSIGLLPDSIFPVNMRRFPLDINPATVVLLGHRLQSRPVQLNCQVIDGKHLVSPWPILTSEKTLEFDVPSDATDFQYAVNGRIFQATRETSLVRPIR